MSEFLVIKFKEAQQPNFKEKKGEGNGYIQFGDMNNYPDYLLELFNKSAKHGAIVRNKTKYVIGNGWTTENGEESEFIKKFRLNSLGRRVALDIEAFGGSYLEIIWSKLGRKIVAINHIDYTKIRTNKDNTQFWYKESWDLWSKVKPEVYPAYDPEGKGKKQILYVKEYRPGGMAYALPGYISAINFIEADVEVSKHVLGNAANGFKPTKLVTLTNGEPSEDEKKDITKRIEKKWSGSDGAGFIIEFVNDKERQTLIQDLGVSALTKEDFTAVDTLIQNNIFAGHEITSPSLFGIAQPGKLGGSTELKDAYDIFKNTYANDKQLFLESVFNTLSYYAGYQETLKIIPINPIGLQFTPETLLQIAPKGWLLETLGIDETKYNLNPESNVLAAINSLSPLVANKVLESMTPNEVRGLATLQPKEGADAVLDANGEVIVPPSEGEIKVNEHIKNMTAKQHMEMMRIIRQFNKGQLNQAQATALLKSGLGLTDEDITVMLGLDDGTPMQMSATDEIKIFSMFGEDKNNFEVLRSRVRFKDDEVELFADVTQAEANVLDLISKDKRITPEVIATTLDISVDRVKSIIDSAISKDFIKVTEVTEGRGDQRNIIIERKLTQPLSKIVEAVKPKTTEFLIRYSYEWLPEIPQSERNTPEHPSRDFCKALMSLNRIYSRAEIEQISARVGYSVFDRRGGWWNDDGDIKPHCRHRWFSQVVTRKK